MHHETELAWLQRECAKTNTFEELADVGVQELRKFHHGGGFVCGPISTGGLGSMEKNNEVFQATIAYLQAKGEEVFNQHPYEEAMIRLREEWWKQPENTGKYCTPIMDVFYARVFDTGLITKAWFIPGWESSVGARWEREYYSRSGVEIVDLTPEFTAEALAAYRTNTQSPPAETGGLAMTS
jgi:hypothetical protein